MSAGEPAPLVDKIGGDRIDLSLGSTVEDFVRRHERDEPPNPANRDGDGAARPASR